jgi:hypothetical protein
MLDYNSRSLKNFRIKEWTFIIKEILKLGNGY